MPKELRESSKPPTPRDKIRVVLLGSGEYSGVFKWNEWPLYPTGPDASPFPMAVICTTAWQVTSLEVLLPYFQMICNTDLSQRQLIEAIEALASPHNPAAAKALNTNRQFDHFYPCLAPNDDREAIYTTWADTRPQYQGQENPRLPKKLPTLLSAIEFMILRGKDQMEVESMESSRREFNKFLQAIADSRKTTASRAEESPNGSHNVGHDAPNPNPLHSHAPHQDKGKSGHQHSHAAPMPSAEYAAASQQAPVEVLTDDEVPEAAAKHASQKGKARHASETGRRESHILPGYSGASGNVNISDAEEEHQPPPRHTDTSTRDPHVYQNYRDFTGQITGHTYKCPFDLRTDIHVPSLGTFLDDYVDRFGYETKFIHRVYKASERSTDRYDFMART
ncbi:uncharacterized protein PHACADRAFT_202254, partial [Phanerochaete carnosa HHB-10118-sp]